MSADVLSEVLRGVRLTGAVFFTIRASEPWVLETPPVREFGPLLLPGAGHVIEYHAVAEGGCWGGVAGEPQVRLEAGDVIAFPQGDAHVLSSAEGMRGDPAQDSPLQARGQPRPVTIRKDGGGPGRAELVCGFLGCDARPFNPLLSALPRRLHVRAGDGGLRRLVELAVAESAAPRAGSEAALARLSELLFVEVVRRHLAALPPEEAGWLAGLRDDAVGRALGRLHQLPALGWSLESLAREVGVSRSVLAERFAHFVGVPPMQYLARWRMQLAAGLLSGTSQSVAEIAGQVGYGSEAALSRAYKRELGVAPADWRRGRRATAPPASPGARPAVRRAPPARGVAP